MCGGYLRDEGKRERDRREQIGESREARRKTKNTRVSFLLHGTREARSHTNAKHSRAIKRLRHETKVS